MEPGLVIYKIVEVKLSHINTWLEGPKLKLTHTLSKNERLKLKKTTGTNYVEMSLQCPVRPKQYMIFALKIQDTKVKLQFLTTCKGIDYVDHYVCQQYRLRNGHLPQLCYGCDQNFKLEITPMKDTIQSQRFRISKLNRNLGNFTGHTYLLVFNENDYYNSYCMDPIAIWDP